MGVRQRVTEQVEQARQAVESAGEALAERTIFGQLLIVAGLGASPLAAILATA